MRKVAFFQYISYKKANVSDTYFEIAPVSLQSRWGLIFSYKYSREYHKYYICKIKKKNHGADFSNHNQLWPPLKAKVESGVRR